MEDQLAFDSETGELPISERAMNARGAADAAGVAKTLGIHNASLNSAIMEAMAGLPSFIATKTDGARGKYANLRDILDAVREPLAKHGIRIRQGADRSFMLDEGGGAKGRLVPVYTDLIHAESGEVERTCIEMPVVRLDPQAMGSAITYGKRYTLIAALGLATDEADDDGEGAKPRSLSDGVKESQALAVLKAEIDKCKDATALYEWGEEVKSKKKAERLTQDEHVLLRKHYTTRQAALLSAVGDEPAEKPKKTKGAAE